MFVQNVTMMDESVRHRLHMKNSNWNADIDGLSTKDVLTNMLEEADMIIIGMIYPLIGALMDLVSREESTCPITTMFTDYVDIMSTVCGITKYSKWNEDELEHMEAQIKTFIYNAVNRFRTYRKSGMCTVKRHALEEI